MDPIDPTQAQFAAYRAMWDYFNLTLFGGALRRVFLIDAMPDAYRLPWTCGIDEDALGKGKAKAKPRRKESKRKYTCPRCTVNVWGKPGLHVRCDDCGVTLVPEHRRRQRHPQRGIAVGIRRA